MLWYILFALVCFALALFAAHYHSHASSECRSVRLNRGGVIAVALLSVVSFYPLLMLYFRLYPVSTPNHFAVTITSMTLTLIGLLLGFFPGRLTKLKSTPWRRQQILAMLLSLPLCLVLNGWLMRLDMASGSLLSWWSPLCMLLLILEGVCGWTLLLQIPPRLRSHSEQNLPL